MSLQVIVVGAGIAGLTAAISLHQAGHSVQVFEKSKFAVEVGAALALAPNGAKVLASLGFSFQKARARPLSTWDIADGVTLKVLNSIDLSESAKWYGSQTYAVHRVDMHNELLRLATEPTEKGQEAVKLCLSSRVTGGNPAEGWIQLQDGSKQYADLIIGADGIHSMLRPLVTGRADVETISTGLSAFRFLIPTQQLYDAPELRSLLDWKGPGASILADLKDPIRERHMMWYACQDGHVQNFVGVHATRTIPLAEDGKQDFKAAMLEDFQAYHPDLRRVITMSDHVSCWPLNVHEPLPTWVNGKMVLIGDAAHPMLPFGGQGSNQAIEDAGALGCVLQNLESPKDVSRQLAIFEEVRVKRASMIQTLSKVRVGMEKEVEQEVAKYALPGTKVPTTFAERSAHAFSHNVLEATHEALAARIATAA